MKFYREIIQKLKDGENFKLSRWGDGEWGCIKGWTGENRDGNTYMPVLRDELIKILDSGPDYYIGLQYGVLYNEELRDLVFKLLFTLNVDLVNGDVLHQASEYGYLQEFVDVLFTRNIVYIGADYFYELPFVDCTIKISPSNSYYSNPEIDKQVNLIEVTGFNPVYLVSAAMNSNVIIDRLPDDVTAIDIGSVFDPYLGRPRAAYQRKMKITPLW